MKVEKTNVHRLSVERECGCKATREFKDAAYKEAIDKATFDPCKKHKVKGDVADMMQMIMVEDVDREASTQSAAAERPAYAPMRAQPTSLDGSAGETVTSTPINRRPVRAAAAPAGGGAPPPQAGPRRDPTQVRTVNRDHSSNDPRSRMAGRAPVTGVAVTNPAGTRPRRSNTVQVGEVELATPGIDLDLDGVPEDPRVTALAEDALLPDLEDDPSQA